MKKIAIVGAGTLGGMLAQKFAFVKDLQIFLYDTTPGRAYGKALDIGHALASSKSPHMVSITGSEDVSQIEGADIVLVTAGFPRFVHMTRNDLLQQNLEIFRDICPAIKYYAPLSTVVVMTNPVDTMTWILQKMTQFPRKRIMGMAGCLDEARFCYYLAKRLGTNFAAIETRVIGVHNENMLPLPSYTTVNGQPLYECMNELDIAGAIRETRMSGTTLVALHQQQSVCFGSANAIHYIILSMIHNQRMRATVSAPYLDDDVYIGQSCIVDHTGIVEIEALDLSMTEEKTFQESITQLHTLHETVVLDTHDSTASL